MLNKHALKIAYVFAPATIATSAQAKYGRSNPFEDWLFKSRELEVISFPIPPGKWANTWKIFVSLKGLIWLFFRLPFRLIKGKYSLFGVHSRDPQAIIVLLIAKFLRKPIIIFDSYYMWIKDDIRASLQWPFSRLVCFKSSYLSVTSARVMNFWVSAGVPAEKIRLNHKLTSIIEPTKKTLAQAIQIKKKLGYKRIILFVGRLVKLKGLDYLIRAFSMFSGFEDLGLLIIGDGPERNRLEKLCEDLNLSNVNFINATAEIEPYFILCDILVLPSIILNIHEEWGLVVTEAMSVAKPVIVSNSVGCAYELVKNGVNGYIVPEKNVNALFKAMEKLIIDDYLRTRMGNNAKEAIANRFTYLHVIESHSTLQQEALKRLVP